MAHTQRSWEQFALLLIDVQRGFWSEQLDLIASHHSEVHLFADTAYLHSD
jgi:hypothetical protein